MKLLMELSLHGAWVFALVWALDRASASGLRASNRFWWWILVPAAFLFWAPSRILPARQIETGSVAAHIWNPLDRTENLVAAAAGNTEGHGHAVWFWIWIAGALAYAAVVAIRTAIAIRRWKRERLCTDPELLGMLEDCKQTAGISAPIGLVITDGVCAPALLGWLRPRILLPTTLAATMPREQMRAVLFHELAHFRALDVPLNWLFTALRAIHWFNPLAHLASRAWAAFREEAADEKAIAWMSGSNLGYGEALLSAIREASKAATPFGAMAIGESIQNLKRRMNMINRYQNKISRLPLAYAIAIAISAAFILRPTFAEGATDVKAAAVTAMQTWLQEIDQNQYAQSWTDASPSFQKAAPSDHWVTTLSSVRTPLGKCNARTLASALEQKDVPSPSGAIKGDFIVAQFNTSFENLAYAVETVYFEKTADGTWKASGYYIKPKS